MKENIIVVKTYSFAIRIIKLNKKLVSEKECVLSKQILHSAILIGTSAEEAIGGISKKVFKIIQPTKE